MYCVKMILILLPTYSINQSFIGEWKQFLVWNYFPARFSVKQRQSPSNML